MAWREVLDTIEYGFRCPQIADLWPETLQEFGEPLGEPSDEDCLVVNVWTPDVNGPPRPVLVYLHGGGWVMGSGAAPAYNGANLARNGEMVVVTLNHRIGILGYLHLADLAGPAFEAAGNVGMLDIVAALRWVRNNIAAFGGDPNCVTLCGQSGGGWKTTLLLTMPAAKGLFHRAIVMSGPLVRVQPPEAATTLARATLDHLGIEPSHVEAIRDVPIERLIDAQASLVSRPGDVQSPFQFAPVLDGTTIPKDPIEAFRAHEELNVPLMIGTTLNEFNRVLMFIGSRDVRNYFADDSEVHDWLFHMLGDATGTMMQGYRQTRPGSSPSELYAAIATDQWQRMPAIRLAELRRNRNNASPAYMYLFAWKTQLRGSSLGAPHGTDVPFAFANPDAADAAKLGPDPAGVAQAMSKAWIAFARSGEPSHPGIPPWPPYTLKERSTMLFDVASRIENDPHSSERALWESLPDEFLGRFQLAIE
jgi:para-nitrobenzyl esterase